MQIMQDCCIGTYMARWFAASIPHHLYLAFLPMLFLPNSPTPHCASFSPPNRPQCVMFPSLCPCVLVVQHLPMSENMRCLIFCSCVSLLKMMISRFIHVPTGHECMVFYGCVLFHGVFSTYKNTHMSILE